MGPKEDDEDFHSYPGNISTPILYGMRSRAKGWSEKQSNRVRYIDVNCSVYRKELSIAAKTVVT